jgi:Protein of unknown function (DUF3224)
VILFARFRVDSAEPASFAGADHEWASGMVFTKTFLTGITGTATTLLMSAGTVEGRRSYVATELVVGRDDDGREGSFVVQHAGLESDESTWFGHVVPATGTGDFAGWVGSARIQHDDDGPYFEFDLSADLD